MEVLYTELCFLYFQVFFFLFLLKRLHKKSTEVKWERKWFHKVSLSFWENPSMQKRFVDDLGIMYHLSSPMHWRRISISFFKKKGGHVSILGHERVNKKGTSSKIRKIALCSFTRNLPKPRLEISIISSLAPFLSSRFSFTLCFFVFKCSQQ